MVQQKSNRPKTHVWNSENLLLRAADRYAYTGCGSTAYSVGTVYGGKGELYTPDARPALLATPRRLTDDALACLTGDALACLIDDALLALLGLTTETRPTHNRNLQRAEWRNK